MNLFVVGFKNLFLIHVLLKNYNILNIHAQSIATNLEEVKPGFQKSFDYWHRNIENKG